MAYDVLCESGVETPFVWTEGAHSLYLTFLEEAFVNDLYLRQYCSPDICGCSPPFPSALADSTATAAESPPSAPPQIPSMVVSPRSKISECSSFCLQPQSRPETKTRRRCPRPSAKVSSLKKKGKWPSQDVGFGSLKTFESSLGLQDNSSLLERPGSSSHSDYVVPKVPQAAAKRSRAKAQVEGIDRLGTDQV
ncbi:hypothetical protein GOP47_0003417 [Adiantum capillus-veneris]|uniref:Uncharacterized protein n=1 Tax=Adiantum capillus-veneris TaxID=13818 RepID=A0A9D4VCR6_ADICA|nr:hypothetical protein GOP47_0003417 [Adiantum capillus-veneris]